MKRGSSQTDTEQLEIFVETSYWARKQIASRTRETLRDKVAAGGEVRVFATVTNPGESRGVVRIATYTAEELYGYAQSPFIGFNEALAKIMQTLQELKTSDAVEYELQLQYLFSHFTQLSRFLNISTDHDELISSLQQLAAAEWNRSVSKDRIAILAEAFNILKTNIFLNSNLLDAFYDKLETAGFDHSFAFNNLEPQPDIS